LSQSTIENRYEIRNQLEDIEEAPPGLLFRRAQGSTLMSDNAFRSASRDGLSKTLDYRATFACSDGHRSSKKTRSSDTTLLTCELPNRLLSQLVLPDDTMISLCLVYQSHISSIQTIFCVFRCVVPFVILGR